MPMLVPRVISSDVARPCDVEVPGLADIVDRRVEEEAVGTDLEAGVDSEDLLLLIAIWAVAVELAEDRLAVRTCTGEHVETKIFLILQYVIRIAATVACTVERGIAGVPG